MKNSLAIIKNNISGMQVVSDSELKILISREENDEETYNTIINFIEESRNNNYTIDVQYDENGLVNAIILSIVSE